MEQAVSMCKEITTVTARITGREGIVKTQGQHAVQGHVKVRKYIYIYKEENLHFYYQFENGKHAHCTGYKNVKSLELKNRYACVKILSFENRDNVKRVIFRRNERVDICMHIRITDVQRPE